ncbi:hypothetical protein MMC28_004884 [Mycoblastus sanguinarius]|nr:hypothetical protein [Mycoblastus sanguinarius]
MPFEVCSASEADLENLSLLVFNAFAQNPIHRVIYPYGATNDIIAWNIEGDRRGMREDKNAHYMCVRDTDTRTIVSYALWYEYLHGDEQSNESMEAIDCPPDTNSDAFCRLDPIGTVKRKSIMGRRPYMYLADIATAPPARRQGAASLLLKWGIDRADASGIPCYLQGSPEGASLYQKHGFVAVDQVVIDLRPWKSPVGQVVNLAMLRPIGNPEMRSR